MRRLWFPGAFVVALFLVAAGAPLFGLPDPVHQNITDRLSGALSGSPLGRDEFGRDVLSRLIWGARVSLTVAFSSALIAGVVGTALGLIGGWYRGFGELITVRSADIILCFPPVLLALLAVTLFGPGTSTLIVLLSVLFLPGFVRIAYSQTLSVRGNEYVEAVRSLGASSGRILSRTILPNIAGPMFVQLSLAVASALMVESGLSFLGLGVVPPAPSWGLMIRGARATMEQAPMLLLWPCAALTLAILGMNRFCDALGDVFNPRSSALRVNPRPVGGGVLPSFVKAAKSVPDALLEVSDLTVEIDTPHGVIRPVEAISFAVRAGETLAIVGESGSGKSITATALMGLLPPGARAVAGSVWFDTADLLQLDEQSLCKLRGGALAMILQDSTSSLNPLHRVGEQLIEAIRAHREVSYAAARATALELFKRIGIADAERQLGAWPHELSGGMRQRVMISMAVANQPKLLIADEPTTALDVTVQAQILDLLAQQKRDNDTALVLITHSLGIVAGIADRMVVMYAGQIVESGEVSAILAAPLHPYTRALLDATPDGETQPVGIAGVVPSPANFPIGCRFAARCQHAVTECNAIPAPIAEARPGHLTRCIRWRELAAGMEYAA
jgi:peptide/nickel transport system permease protein